MVSLNETKVCLLIYLLLAIPSLFAISLATPQFQVADEPLHFSRAYQVYKGNLFPQKQYSAKENAEVVGGHVDMGIYKLEQFMRSIVFFDDRKVSSNLRKLVNRIDWTGELWYSTASVSIYPPFFYIPTACGIAIGKALELNVADSVTVARWVNIVTGLLVASLAIVWSGRCAFFITMILLFPMVLSQIASTSHDALLLPLSALFAATLIQIKSSDSIQRIQYLSLLAITCVVFLAASRPPYAALGLLIFATGLIDKNKRKRSILLYSSCIAIGCSFAWSYYVYRYVSVPFGRESVDYAEQLQFILQHPLGFLKTMLTAIILRHEIWPEQMLGILGWLDTRLQGDYYPYAYSVFLLGIIFYLFEKPKEFLSKEMRVSKLMTLSVLFIAFLGFLLILYVFWTPVGHNDIQGVQGRYFLPLLFASSLLLYRKEPAVSPHTFGYLRLFTLGLFGISAVIATLTSLISRYYP